VTGPVRYSTATTHDDGPDVMRAATHSNVDGLTPISTDVRRTPGVAITATPPWLTPSEASACRAAAVHARRQRSRKHADDEWRQSRYHVTSHTAAEHRHDDRGQRRASRRAWMVTESECSCWPNVRARPIVSVSRETETETRNARSSVRTGRRESRLPVMT